MNMIEQALSDALGHGRDMAGLAGKLRDKLKAGVADMQATYEEAVQFVDSSVAKAKEGVASFKDRVAEIEGEVKGDEAEMPTAVAPVAEPALQFNADSVPATEPAPSPIVSAVVALTGADEAHVAPAVNAHAEAVASGAEPIAAAAQAAENAGADPSTAAAVAIAVDDHVTAAEAPAAV